MKNKQNSTVDELVGNTEAIPKNLANLILRVYIGRAVASF
jgi:hypothetical protein